MATEFNLETAIEYAAAFTGSTGIGCTVLDRGGRVRHPDLENYPCVLCRTVSGNQIDLAESSQGHWRWVEQATRFGGRAVFMCENSFTHWTSPIMAEGRAVGALVAGPVLIVDDLDIFSIAPPDAHPEQLVRLQSLFDRVPRLEPGRVTALTLVLYGLVRAISDATDRTLEEADGDLRRQSRMSEYIQDLKQRQVNEEFAEENTAYPLDKERELLDQIRVGNISRAQKVLNELLGHVFFASGSNISSVRYRTRELVALLSRAVLSEGADPEEVFGLNFRFIDALDNQTDINGVAFWMARIARRFADLVLYLPNVSHGTIIRKAVRYVRVNIQEQIRLADVASHVGLSPTYFSRIFAAEMGTSFVSYVTRMRLDRARDLLRSSSLTVTAIAATVGIPDHSYFTKVFRAETGVTPTAYRRGEEVGDADGATNPDGSN